MVAQNSLRLSDKFSESNGKRAAETPFCDVDASGVPSGGSKKVKN